jgi:alpha/beta superfamily hydrolase
VILAEGFGSDQIALRSLVEAFSRSGYHVLTFDFSGHGRSPGGLDYDNAQTDRLARQLLKAKKTLKSRSGLSDRQILLLGHSLGARSALQSAMLDESPPGGLILIGTQVNLVPSVQAEVFTGVRDTDLDWVNSLGPENPPVNILLISGKWDDILSPQAAAFLHQKLTGEKLTETAAVGDLVENTWRQSLLVDHVLHNYEVYSRKVIEAALNGAENMSGVSTSPNTAILARFRYLSWGGAVLGLFLVIGGLNLFLPDSVAEGTGSDLILENPRNFFRAKILLWLLALIPGALLGGLIFFVPLGTPAFNLIYIAFLGGYGLVLVIFYQRGWMPGISGQLNWDFSLSLSRHTYLAGGVFIILLVLTALFARTGWFFVLPANQRLIWALIFTPITAVGFWIGWQENTAIIDGMVNPTSGLAANMLIGFMPFFLYAGFLAAIGSLSGVIGQLQGLLILFFALNSGILLQKIGKNFLFTSLYQSFLIYWLILAQGVLFN